MANEIFEQRAIGAQSVLDELLEANAGNSVEDLYIAINASHATISAVLAWCKEDSLTERKAVIGNAYDETSCFKNRGF